MDVSTHPTTPQRTGTAELVRWTTFAFSLLAGFYLFRETLNWMAWVFRDEQQDMGHGWLVPLFSLYLVWQRREQVRRACAAPSWAGVLLVLPGLLLAWVGSRGDQVRISQFAMIWLLWAVPYALWGRRLAVLLTFPAVYLLFTVPMAFLDFFTVRLRLLAAAVAAVVLNGVGIAVVRTGTGLHSPVSGGFNLDVADPCSGLRSLFAMTAIGAAYAYLTQQTRWQRWLLFVCAVPLAVIGNVIRIFLIAVVARFFGQQAATGFYHDYSGYVVFVVAVLLLMQVGNWVSRLGAPVAASLEAGPATVAAGPARISGAGWLAVACVPLLLAATATSLRLVPDPLIEPQDFLPAELPEQVGEYRGVRMWFCQNEQCLRSYEETELAVPASDAATAAPKCSACGGELNRISLGERTVLPADTRFLKRTYFGPGGDRYLVTIVINGESRMSIHRPELCLPSQGFFMDEAASAHVALPSGDPLTVRFVRFRRGSPARGGQSTMVQAYWFLSARHGTESHIERILISAVERALGNRVVRWAMVTITIDAPLDPTESKTRLAAFIRAWYPQVRGAVAQSDHGGQ